MPFPLYHTFGLEANPDAGIVRKELTILVNDQQRGPVQKFKPDIGEIFIGTFEGGEVVKTIEVDVARDRRRTPPRETTYSIPATPSLNQPSEGTFRIEEPAPEPEPDQWDDTDTTSGPGASAGATGGGNPGPGQGQNNVTVGGATAPGTEQTLAPVPEVTEVTPEPAPETATQPSPETAPEPGV